MTFLTPVAALVAVLGLAPLAVLLVMSDRAASIRGALGLDESGDRRRAPAAAIAAVAVLIGLAAAQPEVGRTQTRPIRSDAEVLFVIDTSRSMLASAAPTASTRFDRAKAEALRLREQLPDVRVGVASMTDRTLPHLFPNADEQVFRATVEQAIDIERPPPIAYLRTGVTTLAALTTVVTRGFFSSSSRHRVLVVFTDGETRPFDAAGLGTVLRRDPGVSIVFVHVWSPGELIYSDGTPEPGYQSDASSGEKLARAATAARGASFGEEQFRSVAGAVRGFLASGPTTREPRSQTELALAPYLLIAAALPLAFLLARLSR